MIKVPSLLLSTITEIGLTLLTTASLVPSLRLNLMDTISPLNPPILFYQTIFFPLSINRKAAYYEIRGSAVDPATTMFALGADSTAVKRV